jgi:hypothetical protein
MVDIAEISSGRTECVPVDPNDLRPSVVDVTRCAAGPDYQPRDSIREAIERMLGSDILGDVAPVFCFTVAEVGGRHEDGLELAGGRAARLSLPADTPLPAALAAAICTVGEVDERLEGLIDSLGPLDAWIGQGIALAQLEKLEKLCMGHLLELTGRAGLQAENYIEPDVGSPSQQDLFALLDAEVNPVRLTEYGTMQPRMSYSFWLPLLPG